MKVNRRTSVRILAGAAASSRAVLAQAPAAKPADSKELQSARDELKEARERIAMVKLPRDTEPAFRFQA